MTRRADPDPARLAALEVVTRTLAGEFLAPTLRTVLDDSVLEPIQRSQVTDLSYGAVRRLPQLDALLAPRLDRPERLPPRVLTALRLGVLDLLYRPTPAHAAVSQWVEVVKAEAPGLAALANAVLRGVERSEAARSAEPRDGDAVAAESDLALPQWLWERFEAAFGGSARDAALGMLEPEPLWLTAFSASATAALEADGCEVDDHGEGADLPYSLRVRAPMPLDRLTAYRDGLVQPQNPASLHAAATLPIQPGGDCFDLASGRGVKSAVLVARGAQVTAVELSKRRIKAAVDNLRRLGLEATHVAADLVGARPHELLDAIAAANGWQEPRRSGAVLLDAPCSGTGTLRGHPEIKLRLTAEDVTALAAAQLAMLTTAAALVAPGGSLVYAVCALTEDEGPEVVAAFLAATPGFTPVDIEPRLPHVRARGVGVFTLPVAGLDGFYLARLTRSVEDEGHAG